MANAPFDQFRGACGLVVPTAHDANDLAHASARAGGHRPSPKSHEGFRTRTALLAQGFGYD
jgi:hypothetical protein